MRPQTDSIARNLWGRRRVVCKADARVGQLGFGTILGVVNTIVVVSRRSFLWQGTPPTVRPTRERPIVGR